jgi:transcriptional regulator with XRE-family HTH domain
MLLKNIGHRFKEYLNAKKISQNKAGQLIGTSGAQIGNICKGQNFGVDKLLNIIHTFEDLNYEYLLFGRGKMIVNQDEDRLKRVEKDLERIKIKLAALNKSPE